MTDKSSNPQFEFIVESLQPWASRVERQVIRNIRGTHCLVVLAFVALAFLMAVGVWQIWALMPPLRVR